MCSCKPHICWKCTFLVLMVGSDHHVLMVQLNTRFSQYKVYMVNSSGLTAPAAPLPPADIQVSSWTCRLSHVLSKCSMVLWHIWMWMYQYMIREHVFCRNVKCHHFKQVTGPDLSISDCRRLIVASHSCLNTFLYVQEGKLFSSLQRLTVDIGCWCSLLATRMPKAMVCLCLD